MKKILFIPLLLLNVFAFGQGNLDKIYLVDRTEIEGTIQKIDKSDVMFMKIDDPDSLITVRLVTVWKIIYNNGFEEFFNDPLPENLTLNKENKENEKKTHLGFINSKSKSDKAPKEKSSNYGGANFLDKLSESQTWRPLLEIELGAFFPIIFGPESWTSLYNGLGLRYGYGGKIGIGINPIKYVGINFSHGFTDHFSLLPEIQNSGNGVVKEREKITLINRPSSIQLNLYPKEDIVISGGLMFGNVSISNSDPKVNNQPMSGYTFGLGKTFSMGKNKNYISMTANYSILTTEGFSFSLDKEKFPDVDPFEFDFKSLNTIDFKLKFHFGIIN